MVRRTPIVCGVFFLYFLTEETFAGNITNTTVKSTPKPYNSCDGPKSSCKRACNNTQTVHLHGQPKSGTTWLEVILRSLTETTKCGITPYFHPKHSLPGHVKKELISIKPESSYDMLCRRCVEEGLQVWNGKCVKPWENYAGVPPTARFIIILRDPRAVTVSWAHWKFEKQFANGRNRNVDEALRYGSVINGPVINQKFSRKNYGFEISANYFVETVPKIAALTSLRYFWHNVLVRSTNPSLIIFYEDVVRDPKSECSRIASFLELAPDIITMLRVLNGTSAASMRSRESSLPGYNRKHIKVRSASPQAFHNEVSNHALLEATAKMRPLLHPALAAKWLEYER